MTDRCLIVMLSDQEPTKHVFDLVINHIINSNCNNVKLVSNVPWYFEWKNLLNDIVKNITENFDVDVMVNHGNNIYNSSSFYEMFLRYDRILITDGFSHNLRNVSDEFWDNDYDIVAAPWFTGYLSPNSYNIIGTCAGAYTIRNPLKFFKLYKCIESLNSWLLNSSISACFEKMDPLHLEKTLQEQDFIECTLALLFWYKHVNEGILVQKLAQRILPDFKFCSNETAKEFCFHELPQVLYEEIKKLPVATSSPSMYSDWWKNKIIKKPNITLFEIYSTEHTSYIARILSENINQVGIECRHIVKCVGDNIEYKPTLTKEIIIIAPNVFSSLPSRYIAYQVEQSINDRWFDNDYIQKLSSADYILDYSEENIDYLIEKGVPLSKLYYMPITQTKDKDSVYFQQIRFEDKDIDLLFYGDMNCKRRCDILNSLENEFNCVFVMEVFGDELRALIRRSKIILNIHYYDNALLETTRIREALSLGSVIVSETSIDLGQHIELAEAVYFTENGNVDKLINVIRKIISNKHEWTSAISKVKEYIDKYSGKIDWTSRFLYGTGILPLEMLVTSDKVKPLAIHKVGEYSVASFVLSLPETPKRLKAFYKNNIYKFDPLVATKHDIGWIGCGLSYHSIWRSFDSSNADFLEIAEDDCVFRSNIREKIIPILGDIRDEWDIFCGLVTDVGEDFVIEKVEKYQDITFVFFTGMTGTVYNIYNKGIFNVVKDWFPSCADIHAYSIDRYLQSKQNVRCVAAIPYIASQDSDQYSTLWQGYGSNSDLYDDMIKSSEKKILTILRDMALV
jgi:hypothetical protein